MGKAIIISVLLLLSLYGSSQDAKLSKEDRKEARRNMQNVNFQVLDTMLKSKNFVLVADFLENPYGNRTPVLSDLNFIKVDSTTAVLQTGFMNRYGLNGVGGTTAEGSIRGFKMVKNLKNKSFYLRFTVVTDIGIYDVSMTVYADNIAKATITGLTPGELRYDGHIRAINNTGIFKGHNII
jgi:hypothetical protein